MQQFLLKVQIRLGWICYTDVFWIYSTLITCRSSILNKTRFDSIRPTGSVLSFWSKVNISQCLQVLGFCRIANLLLLVPVLLKHTKYSSVTVYIAGCTGTRNALRWCTVKLSPGDYMKMYYSIRLHSPSNSFPSAELINATTPSLTDTGMNNFCANKRWLISTDSWLCNKKCSLCEAHVPN